MAILHRSGIAIVLFLAGVALPSIFALNLREVLETHAGEITSLVQKRVELLQWFDRLHERYQQSLMSPPQAAEADLQIVRNRWQDAHNRIYNFVTGPEFQIVSKKYEEETVSVANFVFGILPLDEMKKLFEILGKDPEISEFLLPLVYLYEPDNMLVEIDYLRKK